MSVVMNTLKSSEIGESLATIGVDLVPIGGTPGRKSCRINFSTNNSKAVTREFLESSFGGCKPIVVNWREGFAVVHDLPD